MQENILSYIAFYSGVNALVSYARYFTRPVDAWLVNTGIEANVNWGHMSLVTMSVPGGR